MTDTPVYLSYESAASALPLGAVAPNSAFPDNFFNAAGAVAQNTSWTSVAAKYLEASSLYNLILKSKHESLEQEVDVWISFGDTLLRLDDSGTAIIFRHTVMYDELKIGIATGLNETSGAGVTYYWLYANSDLLGTVPGYSKTVTDGHYFTFGVSGLDIYAKYNGVEFCRFQEYRHYKPGAVAARSLAAGYGVRTLNVRHMDVRKIYSDPKGNLVDLRDFGVREASAVGSIVAGANTLALERKADFRVGDWVLVETGEEVGAGMRGTVGVGGVWPSQSYADETALQADISKPDLLYAYAEDTGNVWRYNAGTALWTKQFSYYIAKAVPLGLQARITAISADGLSLTLDANASATSTNANVYLNALPAMHIVLGRQRSSPGIYPNDYTAITPKDMTIKCPPGRLAVCNFVEFTEKTGWKLKSAGTTLFSPKGFSGAGIRQNGNVECWTDVSIKGNHGLNGFALDMVPGIEWGGYRADGSINPYFRALTVSQTLVTQGLAYPKGHYFMNSERCIVEDCIVEDVFQYAWGTANCVECWAHRVKNKQNVGFQTYIQWQFIGSDSDRCGTVDCVVECPEIIAAFSFFKCTNAWHIRPRAINGVMEANDSHGWYVEPSQHITGQLSPSTSASVPLMNVNTNAGTITHAVNGFTILDPVMIQDNYVNTGIDVIWGIVVNANNPHVTVRGGFFKSKDWVSGTVRLGAAAVVSTGVNTLVDGMRVEGTVGPTGYRNINLSGAGSKAVNCFAGSIAQP